MGWSAPFQGDILATPMKKGQIRVKKGLNLPITGEPQQIIEDGNPVQYVAVVGSDYVGMKPAEGSYLLIARFGLVYYFGFF